MIFSVCCGLAGAADNPFAGNWKIDASKSSWTNGKFPKNMSLEITMSFHGDELTYHGVNNTNKEKLIINDYKVKMDWKPYPLTINTGRFDRVAVRMIAENEMEVIELKDEDVLVSAIYQLLPGGKRFARRGIAKSVNGTSLEYEEFFDKQ